MSEAAEQLGPRYFSQPLEYKGVVFGLEKFGHSMVDILALAIQEWQEVGDEARFGRFDPDVDRAMMFEAQGGFYVFTIRSLRTMELEGYIIMTVAPSLKQKGKFIASETGVYLQPSARKGRPWLMRKVMTYMENFFREQGAHAIELGHRFDVDGVRTGKFYERCGYEATTVLYHKVLTDG